MIEIARRGFLGGLAAAFAAPAIVRVESIMPVKLFKPTERWLAFFDTEFCMYRVTAEFSMSAIALSGAGYRLLNKTEISSVKQRMGQSYLNALNEAKHSAIANPNNHYAVDARITRFDLS